MRRSGSGAGRGVVLLLLYGGCQGVAVGKLVVMAKRSKKHTTGYTDDHAKSGLKTKFRAIETWRNQFQMYEILVDNPEFTSVCPKTGLPDFGVLTIRYMPREKCLELKSLKEYLFTYRNLGIFQENIVNQVLEDVVKATDPVWAEIKGDFRPRGGISTVVTARYPRT
jgi:7-cyano-7-deazaguanine reductase